MQRHYRKDAAGTLDTVTVDWKPAFSVITPQKYTNFTKNYVWQKKEPLVTTD